ncbi:hypothetical protein Tco_0851596 [Tanacetum coccineum]
MDTKFAKPSILGKPVLQPPINQSVVRQSNTFKSEQPNFSKPRFASQVDVNSVLSKPITPHYLPKGREYVLAKPHHMIAHGSSRNRQEEPYGLNDMVYNHYLEEARKKTQERNRNSKSSVMHITSQQNTTNGSKQKPRWKPTGRIFKTAGLRWIPTRKMFTDSITNVDSEPPNGSNYDITNPYECDQTLNASAGTLNLSAGPAPQRKERCTLQCALSLKEEKFSYLRAVLSTISISSHARSVNKWINPLFDEYFKPPPNVDHPVPEVLTPVPAASASSPSSTTIDQDAPSKSTSQTTSEKQSSVIPQGVEDDFYDIKVAHMDNDPYFGIPIPEPSSEETTLQWVIPSNLHHLNQSFDILTKLTKKHPFKNVIGDPS